MKNKICVVVIMYVSMLLFTACLRNEHISDKEIEKDAEKWMEYIVNEDAEALFDIFASDMKKIVKKKRWMRLKKLLNSLMEK